MTTSYKLLINGTDKTNFISNINWSDNIDALGTELNFEIVNEFQKNIELGSSIMLVVNGLSIFSGLIVARDINELYTSCTCYDFAWYLNKSTVIKQFKKIIGNQAIKELCKEADIDVEVDGAVAIIDCIYKDKTIIEVIKDILEKSTQITTKRFFVQMELNKLKIGNFKKIIVNGKYTLSLTDIISVNDNIENVSYSDNIIDLKNSVIVITGDEKAIRYIGKAKDNLNIEKFGMLQEVVNLDAKDYKQGQNVANNKLKELNKVTQNISLSMLGDTVIKAGRVLNLNIPSKNLVGDYLIKSSSHTLENKNHKVNVTLEEYYE